MSSSLLSNSFSFLELVYFASDLLRDSSNIFIYMTFLDKPLNLPIELVVGINIMTIYLVIPSEFRSHSYLNWELSEEFLCECGVLHTRFTSNWCWAGLICVPPTMLESFPISNRRGVVAYELLLQ